MALGLKSDFSSVTDAVYSDNSGLSSAKGIQLLAHSVNKIATFHSEAQCVIRAII